MEERTQRRYAEKGSYTWEGVKHGEDLFCAGKGTIHIPLVTPTYYLRRFVASVAAEGFGQYFSNHCIRPA